MVTAVTGINNNNNERGDKASVLPMSCSHKNTLHILPGRINKNFFLIILINFQDRILYNTGIRGKRFFFFKNVSTL